MGDSEPLDGWSRGGGEQSEVEKPTPLLPTVDGTEGKGLEVVAAPMLPDANDMSRTGGAATGARVNVRGLPVVK